MKNGDLVYEPIVSVITPTYNHEKFIHTCIKSLHEQSFTNWEQIIVDDGSTDETASFIDKVKDERTKYIFQKNKGIENLAATYNKALDIAKGKYVAILEGDDFWPPDKLEKQLKLFNNKKVVLTWGSAIWTKADESFITHSPPDIETYLELDKYKFIKRLLLGNFISAVTVMIKKEALMAIGGFQQHSGLLTTDFPTWLELLLTGDVAGSNETFGYWRRHGVQISTSRQLELLSGVIDHACSFYNELPETIKNNLLLSQKKIRDRWYSDISISCIYEGRKLLTRKEWKQARKEFFYALKWGNINTRIKAMIGTAAGLGHFEIESLLGLLKKEKINKDTIWY